VGSTHGIEPRRLEQFNPPFLSPVERGGSEWPIVMMHAAARQLDRLAIEKQAFVYRPGKRPDAKIGFDAIGYFTSLNDFGDRSIENGRLWGPELWLGQCNSLCGFSAGARTDLYL
jgi:hypothetical protein